jgi:tetratricopeptide (TPR) repeat protein
VGKKKKRRDRKHKPAPGLPSRVAAALREAEGLMRRRRWAGAAELLAETDRRHPRQRPVLSALLDAYHQLRDFPNYLRICTQLQALSPDNANLLLMLAAAYLVNAFPALSLRAYQQFLERWPDRPEADLARQEAARAREFLEQHAFPALGASGAEGLDLVVLHEEVQVFLSQGRFTQARETAARLLERRPGFVPAWNNTAEAYLREGRYPEAADACRRALAIDPDNFHALSNLTRCLCLGGQMEEAREVAQRLKAVTSTAGDVWVKKAEALSYLGDDGGVLDAWRGSTAAGQTGSPLHAGLLLHLAAVAFCRQGKEDEARRLWQEAVKHSPGLEAPAENLEDLRRPVGQRHAPWPFALRYWLPAAALIHAPGDLVGSHRIRSTLYGTETQPPR